MNSRKWIPNVFKKLFGFENRLNQEPKLRRNYRPYVEQMEDRVVPSTVKIVNINDAAEPSTDGKFRLTVVGATSPAATLVTYAIQPASTAVAGDDYTPLLLTATIPANSSSVDIDVAVLEDGTVEATETLVVKLLMTNNMAITVDAIDTATVNITDDDIATFSIDNVTVNEGDGTLKFTISLSNPIDTVAKVNVTYGGGTATGGGTDYDSATDQVTFNANSTTAKTVTVTIANGTIVEKSETFMASLALDVTTPLTGYLTDLSADGTGTINDNDTATFSIGDMTVNEGNGTITFTVSLTNQIDIAATVNVTYAGGSAAGGGTDYDSTADQVTFAMNTTTAQTVTVAITEDLLVEGQEDFTASLALDGATPLTGYSKALADTATGTINDNDTAGARVFTAAAAGAYKIQLNGGDLEIYQGATLVVTQTLAAFSLTFNGNAAGNTLTIDFSGGNPIPSGGLAFNAGVGSDTLILDKGTSVGMFSTIKHTFTNATDGSISLGATPSIITYTGLDPITDNFDVASRSFEFTGGVETVDLTDTGGADGMMTIDSTLGESVSFANPTTSLTITLNGGDLAKLTSVDAAFAAAVNLKGIATDTYRFMGANVLPNTTDLDVDTAKLDLNGSSQAVDSLTGNGTVTNGVAGAATLTIGSNNGGGTFAGIIQNGVGPVALTKAGNGTTTLSGVNTYTGKTIINGGVLSISAETGLGANPAAFVADQLTLNNGTLETTATFSIDDANRGVSLKAGGGTFNVDNGTTLTIAKVIADVGDLTKTDTGKLILSAVNAYAGKTIINAGTVSISAESGLGTNPAVFTADQLKLDGGTLEATATFLIDDSRRGVTLSAGGGTFDVDAGRVLTISSANVITGVGALGKTDTGTLVLAAANNYTGTTTVAAGTLRVSGSLSNSSTSLVNLTGAVVLDGAGTGQILRPVIVTGTASTAQITNLTVNTSTSTVDGITVQAGANDVVINSVTSTGNRNGIAINAVTGLQIDNSEFDSNARGMLLNGGEVTVTNSTFNSNSIAGNGAGIQVAAGKLVLSNVTVSGNTASGGGLGGGIHFAGGTDHSLISSTIDNNTGAGINLDAAFAGTLRVTNSTVSTNTGIGMAVAAGDVTLVNATFARNTLGGVQGTAATVNSLNSLFAENTLFNYSGSILSNGNNLFEGVLPAGAAATDVISLARLADLDNYGGPTRTHALLPGSGALDAGTSLGAPDKDQRGIDRFLATDIGAFESRGFKVTRNAPAPVGPYRTLISNPFLNPDGATNTNFQAIVVANHPTEPIAGGVVAFSTSVGGNADTGAVQNATATLAADGLAQTQVTANASASLANVVGAYDLLAYVGSPDQTPTVGDDNTANWQMYNQVVTSLAYHIAANTNAAAPQNSRSGQTPAGGVEFKAGASTSTAFSVTLMDQNVAPKAVVISGESIAMRAVYSSGVITNAPKVNNTVITITSNEHGLITGQRVTISGVTGNAAANGTFTITRIDANRFSLNGTASPGNAAYTGGGSFDAAVITNAPKVSNANIVVTSTNHGLITGQRITIRGVLGNLAANGTFTITKIDANRFSLNGTATPGNLAYGGGGTFDKGIINSITTNGVLNGGLVGGLVTGTTVAGVVSFTNSRIFQSVYTTPYLMRASYTNPNAVTILPANGMTSKFRVLPYQFTIAGGNFAGAFQTAYNLTVQDSTRGLVRLLNIVAGENGLGTNQLRVQAFDFFLPGNLNPPKSDLYDGPVFVTFSVKANSVGPNIVFLPMVPTQLTMTKGAFLFNNLTTTAAVPPGGFTVSANFSLVNALPNSTSLVDPLSAGMATVLENPFTRFIRLNLGRQRGR